jgi:hypothetical protein
VGDHLLQDDFQWRTTTMNYARLALATALILAAMATPSWAGGYVKYSCTIDGYSFGLMRQGGRHATLRDATGALIAVQRKPASEGERYVGKDAAGADVDVWMKDRDAVITVGGSARHNNCTIARFAKPGAVNYVCATGYTFATHVAGPGQLDYIDPFGNAAALAVSEIAGHIRYKGTSNQGMTIDLSLANNQASLTTNQGSNNLQCAVK